MSFSPSRPKTFAYPPSGCFIAFVLRQESEREGDGASHSARVRALELLGKYLKMFVERAEVTGKDGDPIQVIEITKFKSAA